MPKDKDAIALLKSDHEKVKKLFKKIEAEEDQEATFDQIKGALEVHATIEEEIFYPAGKESSLRGSERRGPGSLRRT